MTILDIEVCSGLPRASVRFYEKKGFLSPERGANGYREYSNDDLSLLKKIKLLRQLGIPLTDIQAMHRGDAEIAGVVQARIAEITAEQELQAIQQAICGEILETGASYTDLNIESYSRKLQNLGAAPDTRPRPKASDLLRRVLARGIDLGVYCLLYNAFTYFVLFRNAQWPILQNLALCCLLMLIIEPPLLSLFKTTPGKLVFGIRVTDYDGERITILASYARFYIMLSRGAGFVIIPVYNVYRLYRTYREYIERGETYWDEYYIYSISGSKLRTVAGILCVLVIAAILAVSPYAADMPKYRGDLTLEQFTENVNRYMHKNYIGESVGWRYGGVFGYIDNARGTQWNGAGRSTGGRTYDPVIPIVVTGGFVTEVTLTRTGINELSAASFIRSEAYPMYNAFALAQKEINLFTMLFGDVRTRLDLITDSVWGDDGTFAFTVGGVEVVFGYQFVRNRVYANAVVPVYDISFSMRKL